MTTKKIKVLVTGSAGFIGSHLVTALLERKIPVVGVDSINNYYDVQLKFERLLRNGVCKEHILSAGNKKVKSVLFPDLYSFYRENMCNASQILDIFRKEQFTHVCHLAAQAGVRHSLAHPHTYIDSNITGFLNILEGARFYPVEHVVYASSSSVYGLNALYPSSESDNTDCPSSLYAVTKKTNELMAYSYENLYSIPTTGVRFFSVYGPWGRPDMALFLFTQNILKNRPIHVFNNGNMERDFTYIDDIVQGVLSLLFAPRVSLKNTKVDERAPHIYNIGLGHPVSLMAYIHEIEKNLGKKALIQFMPLQPGDVPRSYANTQKLQSDFHFIPHTPIQVGISQFVSWYKKYYNVSTA